MEPLKYFVFNKERDYRRGYLDRVNVTDQGLELQIEQKKESRPIPIWQHGTFISRLLDSGEQGNCWRRAVVQSADSGDDSIRFFFYCSDSSKVTYQGQRMEWEEFIQSHRWDAAQKHEAMRPYLVHQAWNPQDMLLYRAEGRYLWLEIQLFCQEQKYPRILNIKLFAQTKSFLSYLPAIYQSEADNDFLKRFLGMFETVYQDMDARIRDVSRQMDVRTAEPEFLNWMAKWAGISQVHLWPREKLRALLLGIVSKNLIRGTRAYMETVIGTFTGERPFFVEYGQIEQFRGDPLAYQKLLRQYAHDPYMVNILVKEQTVPTRQEQTALMRVIEEIKPAHMEVRLILLKPCIYLDQHGYLGINSVLGAYQTASLDGMTAIPSLVALSGTPERGN